MNKQPLIFILTIFLVSLLVPEAQATNHLPPTTIVFPMQEQDEEPDELSAQLGENRGEIPEGSSQIWTYEGQAGDILTIKAEADNPANDADTEERLQAGLLDMMLIVYAPDGTILAKADDIQPGTITDSAIEGLQLPTDGTYKLEVLGSRKKSDGTYTLTLQAANAASAEPTSTIDPSWPTLTIENQLEDTICYVYIWPTSTEELGDESLGTKQVILPHNEYQWGVAPDEYNIVLSDCYGNTLGIARQFDVTQPSTLTVSPSAIDGPAAECAEGTRLFLEGKSVKALPLLEAGFTEREHATFANPDDKGKCALALGILRENFGNRFAALEAYQVALDIFQVSGNHKLEGSTFNNIGLLYRAQGQYELALEHYSLALEIYREIADRVGESDSLNNMGLLYRAQGQYELALQYYSWALEISREMEDRVGEGTTLNNMGAVYHVQGQYELALEQFNQALEIRREVGNRTGEGTTLNNMGEVYRALGQYHLALEQYGLAIEIMHEVGNLASEGGILNNIGLIYHHLGQYELALEQFNRALYILREVGNRVGEADTLNNIGSLYSAQGQYELALQQFNQALEIRDKVGNRAGEGETLNNIGNVYLNQGQYELALQQFNQALEISYDMSDRASEGISLNNIGSVYRAQGLYELALQQFNQALEIRQEVGDHVGEGTTTNNIGSVYRAQGQYKLALEQYNFVIEIFRQVGNRAGEGTTLNNMALVYRAQGKYDQALVSYQQALEILRQMGDRAMEGITLNNIGFAYEEQGQTEEALVYYEQAMNVFEALRATAGGDQERASFISQYAFLYGRAIGLYHEQGQEEDAFYTSERGRARSFLDSLATGKVQLSDEERQALIDQERDAYDERFALRDQLARVRAQNSPDEELIVDLEAQLEAAEEAYSKAQATIEAQEDELVALVPGRSGVSRLAEVQALLDEQTTLLSYWVLGEQDGTLAFVITADELRVVELPLATPDKLTEALSSLYDWLEKDDPDELKELHSWLVAPLAEHLKTPKVGIIGHQELHEVPFAALTPSGGERYFGQQYTLFRVPSASALSHIQKNVANLAPATQPALVFGNPTTGEELFGPLVHAGKEAASVAELLGGSVYVETEANEARLWSEAVGAPVVHLAAHGSYNSANALYSAIHLAPQGDDDGRLETREVYSLDLSAAEMVVLSACQTNVGDVSRSDEIVGLTRAFFFAGTPTLVSSLWNVDDAATEKLMSAFYRNWQSGMGKAEALQAAQAELRKTHPGPFYWAAFVLNGDPGEVTSTTKEAPAPTETASPEVPTPAATETPSPETPTPAATEIPSSEAQAPAATETSSSEAQNPAEEGSLSWLIAAIVGVLAAGALILVYIRRRMQRESNG